jgi:glycopeptide antibiotics resistance protein
MREQFLLIEYEMITIVIPAATAVLIFRMCRKENHPHTKYLIGILIFICYLFLLLHVTGAGTVYDFFRYGITLKHINLVPFSDTDIDVIGYLLNVVLFLPLGIILPFLWAEFRNYMSVMLVGAALSLGIELSQLVNNRATDIDDLILNTFGAILGFLIYRLICRVLKLETPAETGMTAEMILVILAAFWGRFFLFNELGMARHLFGF